MRKFIISPQICVIQLFSQYSLCVKDIVYNTQNRARLNAQTYLTKVTITLAEVRDLISGMYHFYFQFKKNTIIYIPGNTAKITRISIVSDCRNLDVEGIEKTTELTHRFKCSDVKRSGHMLSLVLLLPPQPA